MAWNQRKGGGGGGASARDDAIANLSGRWERVAEWRPDLTQNGFRAALVRFGVEAFVEGSGASFNAGFAHRTIQQSIDTATAAAVVREAIDSGGGDGNQSLSMATGFEVHAQVSIDAVSPGGWFLLGAFESAGAFPFADIVSRPHMAGIVRTTLTPATPLSDFEAAASNAAARTRAVLANALVVGQWVQMSVQVYPPTDVGGARVRCRVRNMVTGVEVEATIATTLPAPTAGNQMLHAGLIHDVGAAPVGPANLRIARFAVGYPA